MLLWIVVLLLLLPHPLSAPLRGLCVVLHELSHAAIGWGTGASVLELHWTAEEAGFTKTRGGLPVLILLAGYPGTALMGAFCMLAPRWAVGPTCVLGVLIAGTWPMGAVVGGITGYAFLRAPLPTSRVTGAFFLCYTIQDVILDATSSRSDATLLADATHLPPLLFSAAWLLFAVGLLFGMGTRLTLLR